MQKLFEILVRPLADFFKIKHLAILQIDSSTGELIRAYSSGFSTNSIRSLQDLKGRADVFQRAVKTQPPQMVNDISETEWTLSFLAETERIGSLIVVPLFSGKILWGILTLFSQEKFKFKEEDAKIITLFGGQIGELLQLFSSYLRENMDELLVQILGTTELLNFRYKNKGSIPVSEILTAHECLKSRILSNVAGMELRPAGLKSANLITAEENTREEELRIPSKNELEIEEVITIQGEKKKHTKEKKVLVIDDQPMVTDLLVSVLERMNYKSEVASCGREGVEKFEKDDFDLVITDLGMPDISGWEVSKLVKQSKPDVPVIVVTGWGIDPDPNKIKDSKVDCLINKPFQIDQLEKIIKDLLEK
jgi:CheY-like chemotaxis protein